jgi:hypothetical protein
MKTLKQTFFILFLAVLTFTSCENEGTILDDQQQDPTEESEAVVEALAKMSNMYDDSGNLETNSNSTGNIVFDFCFDFVYPITLSYNTGATVAVNDLDELVTIIINSTDQLFVNGIAFPFNVETYNASTGSINIVTINDEVEFTNLLANCDFTTNPPNNCPDIYDPVCVEITDPNGSTFTITYSNECYALEDGFTQADFVDNCVDSNYFDFGLECFDLNYPLDLILDDGSIVTVNDNDEFGNVMFNQYVVNFVYPLSVTLEEDGSVVTVNNETEFEVIFNDCFGGTTNPGDCPQCENLPFDPVCVESITANGDVVIEVFPNLCYAECAGFTAADVVDCNNGGGDPTSCDVASVESIILACDSWNVFTANAQFIYMFDQDGTLDIFDVNFNLITTATWVAQTDPIQNATYIEIAEVNNDFSDVWFFFDCDTPNPIIQSGIGVITNIVSDCD